MTNEINKDLPKCDCTGWCGDDPGIKNETVTPCKYYKVSDVDTKDRLIAELSAANDGLMRNLFIKEDELRAVLEAAPASSAMAERSEEQIADLAATAFVKWQKETGVKSVDQCKSFCAGYMCGNLDRLPTALQSQPSPVQASDAGRQG